MNKTPKLRFKEFSGDWEYKTLESISTYIKRTSEEAIENVLTISAGRGFLDQKDRFSQIIAGNSLSKYTLLYENEFAYNRGNSKKYTYGCIYRLKDYEQALVPNVYISFKLNNQIDKFYEQLFSKKYLDRQLRQLISSSARMDGLLNINKAEFFKVKVPVPKLEEQEKIASFFSLIDDKIYLQGEKVEMLKSYKAGMMQKIFSRELRFKDDDGRDYPEWEEKKLGDICEITTGKLDANAMVEGGQYRFYTCAKEYYRINEYAFDTEALLISGNGANVGYIHYYNGKFNAYQRTYVLDKFSEHIEYIKYYLDKNLKRRILEGKNEGNTPYIVLGTLKDMIIMIPNKEEQVKISKLIKPIELKLEKEQDKLNYLNEYKKGLLQQMFV